MMALEAPSCPLMMLVAWSPGWFFTRLSVGILNFAPPGFCGDRRSEKKISPGRDCVCPVFGSTVPASDCSCPAPRGGSRAAQGAELCVFCGVVRLLHRCGCFCAVGRIFFLKISHFLAQLMLTHSSLARHISRHTPEQEPVLCFCDRLCRLQFV